MSTASDISSIAWTKESLTDNQIKENFSTVNKRKIIIAVSITLLIVMIVIVMATMIPLLYYNKNMKSRSTTTTDDNAAANFSEITPVTIYDIGAGGISGEPPCTSYTVVNDPSRNIYVSGISSACDSGSFFNTSIGGRWIRFMGTGGTIISPVSAGKQHCGAYLTAWFDGILPSIPDVIVNASICVDFTVMNCGFHMPISVVQCTNFYVYFLPPIPMCNIRYCTV